ncbi:hypothetical protein QR98_0071120 [Sarcoptes scabiei]|uniref:Uncharacterized protein n=1 Tax=Sarcoptes scabiei TaxID=52283 RepID=A0A132ADR9_SARSC|nr:hypothetical protein QR98_0071120 [Sarcoptes scabiei]
MSFVMREYGLEESFENFWFDTVIIQVHYLLYSLLFWFVLVKHINPNIFTDLWEEIKHFFLRESKMINNLMRVINSSTVSDQTSDEISFKNDVKIGQNNEDSNYDDDEEEEDDEIDGDGEGDKYDESGDVFDHQLLNDVGIKKKN